MIVTVDVGGRDIQRIADLMKSGKVKSISEFVSTAIKNQIELEENPSNNPSLEDVVKNQIPFIQQKNLDKNIKVMTVDTIKIPSPFPFWGTQNKYLCLKQITIDFIQLISTINEQWVRYDLVMNSLLKNAVETHKRFELLDVRLHRPRGNRFATSFPSNDSKSLTRYEKQFIGGMDSLGGIYGMAVEIGFLRIRRNDSKMIEFGITEEGLKFARIPSVLFSDDPSTLTPNTSALNEREIEIIISSLKNQNREEIKIMKFYLDQIRTGSNTPEKGKLPIKEFLDAQYPNISKKKDSGSYSLSEADSIRSGLISRLSELGLIDTEKKGQNSEYHVTVNGERFLKDVVKI